MQPKKILLYPDRSRRVCMDLRWKVDDDIAQWVVHHMDLLPSTAILFFSGNSG